MEFILTFGAEFTPCIKEEIKPEIKVNDILRIEEEPDQVIEVLNVFDLCKTPFYYACSKAEMLNSLQSHSTDIAITSISAENWKDELKGICEMLGFRSSIYILDKDGVHNSNVESFLSRRGYTVAKEGKILDYLVVEYEKGYELSIIDCFNPYYTIDIFSIMFITSIGFGDVVYCDVPELIDIFYYGIQNDKNVFMPIPFSQMPYIDNYLNSKVAPTTKVDANLQINLF